jgi:hypothetical protein
MGAKCRRAIGLPCIAEAFSEGGVGMSSSMGPWRRVAGLDSDPWVLQCRGQNSNVKAGLGERGSELSSAVLLT